MPERKCFFPVDVFPQTHGEPYMVKAGHPKSAKFLNREVSKPKSFETEKFRNREVSKPRSFETEKFRNREVSKPKCHTLLCSHLVKVKGDAFQSKTIGQLNLGPPATEDRFLVIW